MNERANELMAALTRLFDGATAQNGRIEKTDFDDFKIVGDDRETFDALRDVIERMLSANFRPDIKYAVPDPSFSDSVRKALAYRPFTTYEGWHVAPDVTEERLLAAESDIRAGNLAALEGLRDQANRVDFVMPMGSAGLNEYVTFLSNLRYLLVVLAHQAKRFSSFPSAHAFLSAASLISKRSKLVPPFFRDDHIDKIVDWIEEGIDELQVAADYCDLEAWETFAPREGARLAEVLKERDESKEAERA